MGRLAILPSHQPHVIPTATLLPPQPDAISRIPSQTQTPLPITPQTPLMVTTPPTINSPDDVIAFIPDTDLAHYDHLDKDDIRDGHACQCNHSKYGRSQDSRLYSADKTAIKTCNDCGGYYGIVLNNWY